MGNVLFFERLSFLVSVALLFFLISSSIRFFDLDPFTVSSSGRMFSLKSRLSFCSLNARGLKDKVKRKGIFFVLQGAEVTFCFSTRDSLY